MPNETATPLVPPLVVDAVEVARLIAISPRSLWAATAPRGDLPCIRIGRMVRYRPQDLQDWLERHRANSQPAKRDTVK
jgi:hypothetical protein